MRTHSVFSQSGRANTLTHPHCTETCWFRNRAAAVSAASAKLRRGRTENYNRGAAPECSRAPLFDSFAAQPGPRPVCWIAKTQKAQPQLCSTPSQLNPGHLRFAGLPRLRGLYSTPVPLLRSAARPSGAESTGTCPGALDSQESEGSVATLFHTSSAQPCHHAQRLEVHLQDGLDVLPLPLGQRGKPRRRRLLLLR